MTKTFCDRCEKEITNIKYQITLWDGNFYCGAKNVREKELCPPCFTALESFLNNK